MATSSARLYRASVDPQQPAATAAGWHMYRSAATPGTWNEKQASKQSFRATNDGVMISVVFVQVHLRVV